jgi:uncharacterized protein (TIGR02145 family)
VQVRVKISVSKISGATITNIGTVTIENQNTVDLTVQDGALSNYTNVGALDVSSSLYTGDNVTYFSDYYVFHPSPTRVNISSIEITVGGIPKTYSNLFATFTQGLTEAGNYTLAVDLEKYGLAGSNIYWTNASYAAGELRFDKVRTWIYSASYSDQYQGVFFKWGSLIGHATNLYVSHRFVPPVNEGETWTVQDGLNPAVANGTTTATNVNYLYNNPNYTSYIGDICSYLTNGGWRIPNAAEFNGIIGNRTKNQGDFPVGGLGTENARAGRSFVLSGVTFHTTAGSIFFPHGWKNAQYNAENRFENAYGFYWSGTPNGSGKAYYLYLDGNAPDGYYDYTAAQVLSNNNSDAFPIRCIKN